MNTSNSSMAVDMANPDTVLCYIVDWYDPLPQIKKKFVLRIWPSSNCMEMLKHGTNKVFLRKTVLPENTLNIKEIKLGKIITLFGRNLEFVDYFDSFTRQFGTPLESSYTFYFSYNPLTLSSTIAAQTSQGRDLLKLNMLIHKRQENDVVIECSVTGSTPIQTLSIDRSCYEQSYSLSSCTCLIVKSEALQHLASILDIIIKANFAITGIKMHHFTEVEALELLQVYFDVVPSASDMVTNLTSGLTCCLELRAENAVLAGRELCGPIDCSLAKELRPNSLRGRFGVCGIASNGIHVTDLEEDGTRECEYVFAFLN